MAFRNGEINTYHVVKGVTAKCECGKWEREGNLVVESSSGTVTRGSILALRVVLHHRKEKKNTHMYGHSRVDFVRGGQQIGFAAVSSDDLEGLMES